MDLFVRPLILGILKAECFSLICIVTFEIHSKNFLSFNPKCTFTFFAKKKAEALSNFCQKGALNKGCSMKTFCHKLRKT